MGSKAGLSCLWTPTRQSFAPPPWFQLFSHLDRFSKACLLFVMVSKREQTVIARGAWEESIDSIDMWKRRSAYCPCSSSFLFCDFPTPGGTWLNVLSPHSLAGVQCFWGLSAIMCKAYHFCFLDLQLIKGQQSWAFFSVFFFLFGFVLG